MRRDGVNFYERGANIGFLNCAYMALGATLRSDGRRELLRRFQVMTRDRTRFAYESFWESFRHAVEAHRISMNCSRWEAVALCHAEGRCQVGHLRHAEDRLFFASRVDGPPQVLAPDSTILGTIVAAMLPLERPGER